MRPNYDVEGSFTGARRSLLLLVYNNVLYVIFAAAGVPQLLRGGLLLGGPALHLRVLPCQPQPDVGHVQPGTCYIQQ